LIFLKQLGVIEGDGFGGAFGYAVSAAVAGASIDDCGVIGVYFENNFKRAYCGCVAFLAASAFLRVNVGNLQLQTTPTICERCKLETRRNVFESSRKKPAETAKPTVAQECLNVGSSM